MVPFEGGCLCGGVRYKGHDEPIHVFYCHCTDCQKETGGPFAIELYLPRRSVTVNGALRAYDVIGDSGKVVTRKFCPSCGCPVVTEFGVAPDDVCIKAGSLDDGSWLKPQFHLYIKSKQPWLQIVDGLPQHQSDF